MAEKVKKKKKLAIVGFAGTRDDAPYNDPEFEIWTVNNLYRFVPRQDVIFELHTREQIDAEMVHGVDGKTYVEELRAMKIPVYMQEAYPDIPSAVRYPIEEMVSAFGIPRKNPNVKDAYFTNSISYMLALGIYQGFEEIHVYGVDMAVGTEYNEQRPSCEYYVGIAVGRGIKVYLPTESDLLKTRFMYGYEEAKLHAWELKVADTLKLMHSRHNDALNSVRMQQSVSDKYEGAITAVRELQKVLS